ncbi:MAG: fatty acid desaturase [Bdellovibrionota bacterium]
MDIITAKSNHKPQGSESLDWGIISFLSLVHILAITAFFFTSWNAFFAFLALYVVSGMGITFGFHRLFTHRSFKVPKWIEYIAALAGTFALQGSVLKWVAHHRMHHAFSDHDKDPHNSTRGFWYSHIFWTCYNDPSRDDPKVLKKFARDIAADPVLLFMSSDAFLIGSQIVLGSLLWIFGGFEVMMWGVWVRLAALYHATWFVNSAAHLWGYRTYDVNDSATNNWWVGLLTFGEGWHNNHHAYSDVAPAGHRWWEVDTTWMLIKTLSFFGLATHIKLPPPINAKAKSDKDWDKQKLVVNS